jgi:hypothetical protein
MANNALRNVITAALTGTGSAATLFPAGGSGFYVDITSLIITSSTTTAQATLSDGTSSYVFNVANGSPVALNFSPPLKAASANTAWTLNAPSTMNAVGEAVASPL